MTDIAGSSLKISEKVVTAMLKKAKQYPERYMTCAAKMGMKSTEMGKTGTARLLSAVKKSVLEIEGIADHFVQKEVSRVADQVWENIMVPVLEKDLSKKIFPMVKAGVESYAAFMKTGFSGKSKKGRKELGALVPSGGKGELVQIQSVVRQTVRNIAREFDDDMPEMKEGGFGMDWFYENMPRLVVDGTSYIQDAGRDISCSVFGGSIPYPLKYVEEFCIESSLNAGEPTLDNLCPEVVDDLSTEFEHYVSQTSALLTTQAQHHGRVRAIESGRTFSKIGAASDVAGTIILAVMSAKYVINKSYRFVRFLKRCRYGGPGADRAEQMIDASRLIGNGRSFGSLRHIGSGGGFGGEGIGIREVHREMFLQRYREYLIREAIKEKTVGGGCGKCVGDCCKGGTCGVNLSMGELLKNLEKMNGGAKKVRARARRVSRKKRSKKGGKKGSKKRRNRSTRKRKKRSTRRKK